MKKKCKSFHPYIDKDGNFLETEGVKLVNGEVVLFNWTGEHKRYLDSIRPPFKKPNLIERLQYRFFRDSYWRKHPEELIGRITDRIPMPIKKE